MPLANSVVRYTGNEISIAIEENDSVYAIDETFTEVGETSATAPGKHIAKVRIIAAENYTFSNNFSEDGEYFDSGRGVTVVVSEDGKTATITKEWYIVEVDNRLVKNGTTEDYEIQGWVYNHLENNPVAPEILHVADESSYSGASVSRLRETVGISVSMCLIRDLTNM